MRNERICSNTLPSTPPGSEYVAADGNTYVVGADGFIIIDSEGVEYSPADLLPVPPGTAEFNARYSVIPGEIVEQVLAAS